MCYIDIPVGQIVSYNFEMNETLKLEELIQKCSLYVINTNFITLT